MKFILSIFAVALLCGAVGCKSGVVPPAVTPPTSPAVSAVAQPVVPPPASPVVQPAAPAAAPAAVEPVVNEVAIISTTEGDIVMGFWPDVAPKTVANFKTLAKKGFYDGTCFHRIISGFMIQGGDPLTKDLSKEEMWGSGGPGYSIAAEFNSRPHEFGVISMARSASPDSAGSQFFICHGRAQNLDNQYTAFGKMIKGDDVLNKIAATPVVPNSMGEPSKPTKRVEIKSVKIVPADSVK